MPHAASVYFVADEHLSLYFLSATSSQHVQDLALNPLAALTIEPLVARWQEIRGLQLRGKVSQIPNGFQSLASWARYLAKFPYVKILNRSVEEPFLRLHSGLDPPGG